MANDEIMKDVRTMVDRLCAEKGEAAKAMVQFGVGLPPRNRYEITST